MDAALGFSGRASNALAKVKVQISSNIEEMVGQML